MLKALELLTKSQLVFPVVDIVSYRTGLVLAEGSDTLYHIKFESIDFTTKLAPICEAAFNLFMLHFVFDKEYYYEGRHLMQFLETVVMEWKATASLSDSINELIEIFK